MPRTRRARAMFLARYDVTDADGGEGSLLACDAACARSAAEVFSVTLSGLCLGRDRHDAGLAVCDACGHVSGDPDWREPVRRTRDLTYGDLVFDPSTGRLWKVLHLLPEGWLQLKDMETGEEDHVDRVAGWRKHDPS